MVRTRAWCALSVIAALIAGCTPSRPPYPPAEKKPVTELFGATRVEDDYRWLDNASDPAVRSWVASENALSRSRLDQVNFRGLLAARLRELYTRNSVSYRDASWAGKLFVIKEQPPRQQPILVSFDSPDDLTGEKTIIDPNAIDTTGGTSIDFYAPSGNGKLVAASLSRGGSEEGTAFVFECSTGRKLADSVPRVNFPTGGGSIAWNSSATGFYYTRYPQGEERPEADRYLYQQIYFHRLGTPAANDRYVGGKDFPRIAEISLSPSDDGRYLLARVANGDGGDFAFYMMGPGERWKQILQYTDRVHTATFGPGGKLYLISTKDAPRGKVLALPVARPEISRAQTVIPESDAVITSILTTADRLYCLDMVGGPSQVRIFDLRGMFRGMFPTGPVASVSEILSLKKDLVLYGTETYLEGFAYFRYDPGINGAARTRLANSSAADFSDCEVVRDSATSRDGTKVPLTILRRRAMERDGRRPVLLYGYGGFGRGEAPRFSPRNRLWLDQGGVYVDANLRGGNEFGESWHAAGKLTSKQNVFDDFIACAEYMIRENYTTPEHLAIEGWSNGGLLMGAALVERPDLFRAVVSHVGIYDMLHVEQFPNGAFNATEFGSVKDPEIFRALYGYSPYHHVLDGTKYPAVLMMTGDNDGRVDPANSRKMTARLQEATGSSWPVLLRTSPASGHGYGSPLDERIAQDVDAMTFLFDQLGITYRETP